MTNKLTDKEIVKALECCVNEKTCKNCTYSGRSCMTSLKRDTLDLINRLQAENAELKDTVKVLRVGVEQAHLIRKDSKSPLSLIKAEAYKECIEKVKQVCKYVTYRNNRLSEPIITYHITKNNLNNLLKELVGEDNA